MATEWFRTEQEQQVINAEIDTQNRIRGLAEDLARHLKSSSDPDADTWSAALAWFAKRIKGGHLSIYAQEDYDRRFGPVDWAALKGDDKREVSG